MLATIWSNWYSPTMINETIAAMAAMIRLLSAEAGRTLGVGGGDVIVSEARDPETSRLGLLRRLLEVVLWNRGHRVFEDLRIPALSLRQPRDHRARDAQEPGEESERDQVHPVVTVHARAPRFFSHRAYHHMIPMKA